MRAVEILLYPDPRLTAKNAEIGIFTEEAAARVSEMVKLNLEACGAGLAAPQVGWNVRLFILSVPAVDDPEPVHRAVWNPVVTAAGGLVRMREGCLSFPGVWAEIRRWTRVRLVGRTPEGPLDRIFTGIGAQAVQHELDHLDGILFTEKMTEADRLRNRPLLVALEERARKKDGGA